jgi:hypothetical protein
MSETVTDSAGVTWGGANWSVIQNLRYNTAVFDAFSPSAPPDIYRIVFYAGQSRLE